MKKRIIPWIVIVCMVLSACGTAVPEPERCSLCDDLSRHAPCIINLSTGEKLELDVYEPHPFLVGEIAESMARVGHQIDALGRVAGVVCGASHIFGNKTVANSHLKVGSDVASRENSSVFRFNRPDFNVGIGFLKDFSDT